MRSAVVHRAMPLFRPLLSISSHVNHHSKSTTVLLFRSSSSSSSSASVTSSGQYYHLRKRRRWPLLPYKSKWQETFHHQQAMQSLKQSAMTASTPLLYSLIDSFAAYNCDPTPNAYHFVIKILSQRSKLDQIPPILDRIEHAEKFETPEFIFVDLIRIYGKANYVNHAIDLFFRIPKFRCVPTSESLNSLLEILCWNREGIRIVPQILLKSQIMNIRLEESSFCILIEALCRIRKVNYAIKLLGFMVCDGYGINGSLCSLILSTLCARRDTTGVEVMVFLEEMMKLGFLPKRVDWCNVIKFLTKRGKGMDALAALERMKMDGIKPDVVCYTLVLDGIVAEGKFKRADQLFDEMLVLGLVPHIHTYNVYINGLCKQSKVDEGVEILGPMEELGCRPTVATYNLLLHGFCKVGKLSRAMEILKDMQIKGVEFDMQTYRIIIDGLLKEGEIDEACRVLREVLNKGFVVQSSMFDDIICHLCQRGLLCKALDLLKETVGKKIAPGIRAWEALLLECKFKCSFEEITPFGATVPFPSSN